MAAVLRDPWICNVAESELKAAFQSFRHSYLGQPELLKGNRYCRPSGVEIHLKKNKQAQVVDFDGGLTRPYDAILSDGVHRIRAVFERDVVEKFTHDTARDLRDIRGGIIVLQNYHLIVNPGSSAIRLNLNVLGFKLCGSEGSSVMGRPVDVLTLQNVEALVGKLESLLASPQDNCQAHILSPTTSQGKISQPSSQPSAGFATQVNPLNEKRVPSPLSAQESITRDKARLVALLEQVSKKSHSAVQKPATVIAQKSALGPVPERKVAAMKSKLDAKANVQRNQSLTLLASSSSVDVGSGLKSATSNMPSHASLPDDDEKENSQELAKHQQIALSQPGAAVFVQPCATDFVDQLQRDDAFVGLKRVPRRYVRIPEDQRAILERSDCWYEPKADEQTRYANIPAKVMKDLAEFRSRKPTGPQLQTEDLAESSSESGEDSGLDSAAESGCDGPRSVDSRQSYGHRDSMCQGVHNDKSSRIVKPSAKVLFPSSGPEIVHVADGSDDYTDEDDALSWEPTPEPDEAVFKLESGNTTQSQPPPGNQDESAPSCKPRGKPYVRCPVNIPPSSPTIDEELELAVPYAVGDIVNPEGVRGEVAPIPSQELPSTAPPTSTYIQVKRTPYVKSRSFDEGSLQHSSTGSKKTQDDVSSDPVIPATFHDTSNSEKQVSSSRDQISAGMEWIAGTQLSTGHLMVDSQDTSTHSQDVIITSSLQHTDVTTNQVMTEKPSTSHQHETEKQHIAMIQSTVVMNHPAEQKMAQNQTPHSEQFSRFPSLHAAGLANYAERQHQYEGETLKSNTGKAKKHDHIVSPKTRLTKAQRKMFFFDLEAEEDMDERPKDELLLEERRRARDAKRNFKAKEKLTRRPSEVELEGFKQPSSPALNPRVSNLETTKLSEADPQSAIRSLLSPTPDLPVEIGEPEELTETGQVESRLAIPLGQLQDNVAIIQDLPPQEAFKPEYLTPLDLLGTDLHEQPSFREIAERDSVAFATPPRKAYVHPSQDSFGPESPSSAQPMADGGNRQPFPRQSLGPGAPSPSQPHVDDHSDLVPLEEDLERGSPFAQTQAEEGNHQQSLQESIEVTSSPPEKSQCRGKIEQSPFRSRLQPSIASPSISRAMDNEPSPQREKFQAEKSIPLDRHRSNAHPQTSRQISEQQTVPTKPVRNENQDKNIRVENDQQSKDLTFDGFVSTYPDYSGDKKCFTRALVCLEWLRKKRIPPWSICDDFIRAYAEWEPYVRNLKKLNPEKVTTAWEYYDNNVKATLFEQKFVDDKDKLATLLSSLNPLYVQTIRDAYNAPAADPNSEMRQKEGSKPASTSPEAVELFAEGRGISPELGSTENPPRRHTRGPFFETPSQLQPMQQMKAYHGPTGSTPDTERIDKMRRTLPWTQSMETRDQKASPSQSRRSSGRSEPKLGSTEFKKRRQSNEQRRATLPPSLRAAPSNLSMIDRKEQTRPASRDSEVFETHTTSESVFQAASLSPELPDLTEKWVAQQLLVDDSVVEEPRIEEPSSIPRKKVVKGSVDARRETGFSVNADSPRPAKKRRFRDLAEFAKDLGNRRRSGGISSRASTPYSTPAKRFCTKPKGETPGKRGEPDTQAWQY